MRVTGLVLAGGYSTRMGTDKSELTLSDGRTLLQRQVDLLHESGIAEVLVARRRDQSPAPVAARTVFDIAADSGPMAGIAAGLAEIGNGMLFVIAVDMPRISIAVVREMIALAASGKGVIPHRGQSIECLIGIYPGSLATLAAQRVASRQLRVREFAALAEESGQALPWKIPPSLVPEFKNWNTPEDIEKTTPGSASL